MYITTGLTWGPPDFIEKFNYSRSCFSLCKVVGEAQARLHYLWGHINIRGFILDPNEAPSRVAALISLCSLRTSYLKLTRRIYFLRQRFATTKDIRGKLSIYIESIQQFWVVFLLIVSFLSCAWKNLRCGEFIKTAIGKGKKANEKTRSTGKGMKCQIYRLFIHI